MHKKGTNAKKSMQKKVCKKSMQKKYAQKSMQKKYAKRRIGCIQY